MSVKNFRCLSWNARGLCDPSKLIDLKNFLWEHKPHIVAIQETFWKPNFKPYCHNYKVYRLDRPQQTGGGVALLIQREVKSVQIDTPKLAPFEIVSAKVGWQDRYFIISSLYSPKYTKTFKNRVANLF